MGGKVLELHPYFAHQSLTRSLQFWLSIPRKPVQEATMRGKVYQTQLVLHRTWLYERTRPQAAPTSFGLGVSGPSPHLRNPIPLQTSGLTNVYNAWEARPIRQGLLVFRKVAGSLALREKPTHVINGLNAAAREKKRSVGVTPGQALLGGIYMSSASIQALGAICV